MKDRRFTAEEGGINFFTTPFKLGNRVTICEVVPVIQLVENNALQCKSGFNLKKHMYNSKNAL